MIKAVTMTAQPILLTANKHYIQHPKISTDNKIINLASSGKSQFW